MPSTFFARNMPGRELSPATTVIRVTVLPVPERHNAVPETAQARPRATFGRRSFYFRREIMGLLSKPIKTLDDLFVHTLEDVYYAEQKITKALPKMIAK